MGLAIRSDPEIEYYLPDYNFKCSLCWTNDQTSYSWIPPPVETETQDDISFVHQSNHFSGRIIDIKSIILCVVVDVIEVMTGIVCH